MLQPAACHSLVGLALSDLLHNPVGVTAVRTQLAVLVKHCRVGVSVSRTSVDNTLQLRTIPLHPAPVTSLVHLKLVLIQEEHSVPRAVKARHNLNFDVISREATPRHATLDLLNVPL